MPIEEGTWVWNHAYSIPRDLKIKWAAQRETDPNKHAPPKQNPREQSTLIEAWAKPDELYHASYEHPRQVEDRFYLACSICSWDWWFDVYLLTIIRSRSKQADITKYEWL